MIYEWQLFSEPQMLAVLGVFVFGVIVGGIIAVLTFKL